MKDHENCSIGKVKGTYGDVNGVVRQSQECQLSGRHCLKNQGKISSLSHEQLQSRSEREALMLDLGLVFLPLDDVTVSPPSKKIILTPVPARNISLKASPNNGSNP